MIDPIQALFAHMAYLVARNRGSPAWSARASSIAFQQNIYS